MNSTIYKTFTIHHYEELESSNKTAFELASLRKNFDSEIILTKRQTAGKGRKNREWSSPEGNLYFSIILQPKITVKKIPQISFIAALALKMAIISIFIDEKKQPKISLKWPNDLLIEGKKIAGILLESKMEQQNCDFVILGIGLNIISNPNNTIFPADNLKNCGVEILPEKMLEKFLDEFETIYRSFINFGFANTRQLWLKHAYKLKEKIILKIDGEEIEGIFEDLDEDGNLLLRSNQGIIKITAADMN